MVKQISSHRLPLYFKGGARSSIAHEIMDGELHKAQFLPEDSYSSRRKSQDERLVAAAQSVGKEQSAPQSSPYVPPTQILPYAQTVTAPSRETAHMKAVSRGRRQGYVTQEEYDKHRNDYEASRTYAHRVPAPGAAFARVEFTPPAEAPPLIEKFTQTYLSYLNNNNLKTRDAYRKASRALKHCFAKTGTFPKNTTHYGETATGQAIPFYRSPSPSPTRKNGKKKVKP